MKPAKEPEGSPMYFCGALSDDHLLSPDAACFAIRLAPVGWRETLASLRQEPRANLSARSRAYLASLSITDPDADPEVAALVWMHALAVGYSPAYLKENADGIRRDWPRIPLPDSRKALEASAALGRQVAALMDTEAEAPGVTGGKIEAFFKTVSVLPKTGGGSLAPDAGDLAVTAGWGHAGKDGVTMPAKGRIVERPFDKAEREAIAQAAEARALSAKAALALLGGSTRDVYLNDRAYWKNVPAGVWEYFIGGYQVLKKWLSYREAELLGRPLTSEEAREAGGIARRLAALVLMQPALDENYRRAREKPYAWPASTPPGTA